MKDQYRTQNIRSLVQNYTVVPGLILATIGGYAVFIGAFSMVWNKWLYWVLFGSIQNSWIANLGIAGSFLLPYALYLVVMLGVKRYYNQRFGEVKPRVEETNRLTIELIGACIAYFFVGQALDLRLHSPVSITMLIFAAFLLIHWWTFARMQRHYLVLAAITIALSFVPLFNSSVYFWLYIKDTAPDWYGFNTAICAGLLLVIAGLLDHLHMVRTLAQVRDYISTRSEGLQEITDVQTGITES